MFFAALQGVDLKKDAHSEQSATQTAPTDGFAFGDPADYEHLSDSERASLTEKMTARHKKWVDGKAV